MGMNIWTCIGWVDKAPQLLESKTGTPYCRFVFGYAEWHRESRKFRNPINVVCFVWGRLASEFVRQFNESDRLAIVGELHQHRGKAVEGRVPTWFSIKVIRWQAIHKSAQTARNTQHAEIDAYMEAVKIEKKMAKEALKERQEQEEEQ